MHTELIRYSDGEREFEGFLASSDRMPRATVVLCHAWGGRDAYICEKAEWIASWGYTAFAIDLYGKGVLGKSPEENAALKRPLLEDRSLLKKRIESSFAAVVRHPLVRKTKMVVLGFGFGGLAALDFARYYSVFKGAISIYGHFVPPFASQKETIKSRVLILHGFDDPVVTLTELNQFQERLARANVDWQTHLFSDSMHAFSTPSANRPEVGIAYNPLSAKRAWMQIRNFIEEVLSL